MVCIVYSRAAKRRAVDGNEDNCNSSDHIGQNTVSQLTTCVGKVQKYFCQILEVFYVCIFKILWPFLTHYSNKTYVDYIYMLNNTFFMY